MCGCVCTGALLLCWKWLLHLRTCRWKTLLAAVCCAEASGWHAACLVSCALNLGEAIWAASSAVRLARWLANPACLLRRMYVDVFAFFDGLACSFERSSCIVGFRLAGVLSFMEVPACRNQRYPNLHGKYPLKHLRQFNTQDNEMCRRKVQAQTRKAGQQSICHQD